MEDKKEDKQGEIKFAKKPAMFSTYGNLKSARAEDGKDTQPNCYYCKEKFIDTDGISLAMVVGMVNQLIHDDCCQIINNVN